MEPKVYVPPTVRTLTTDELLEIVGPALACDGYGNLTSPGPQGQGHGHGHGKH